jgi:phage shock protein E
MKTPVLMASILLITLSACADGRIAAPPSEPAAGPSNRSSAWTELAPADLSSMLENKDFFLVNVHVPYEGELPMTDAIIPFDEIGSRLAKLPRPDANIVLYCRTGRMSEVALQTLSAAGYSNLSELEGGFEAWRSAGLPFIEQGSGEATERER